MRWAAPILVLAVVAACSPPSPQPQPSSPVSPMSAAPSRFPAWTALGAAGVPSGAHPAIRMRLVSGDHGFLLLASYNEIEDRLYSSRDGREWAAVPAPSKRGLDDLVSNGRDIFLLEGVGRAEHRVWTYRGRDGWKGPAVLGSSFGEFDIGGYLYWAITAGPRGIVVAHSNDAYTEVELWSSADGTAFEKLPNRVRVRESRQRPHSTPLQHMTAKHGDVLAWSLSGQLKIVAADGFPVSALDRLPAHMNVYQVVIDGRRWSMFGLLDESPPPSPGREEDDDYGNENPFRVVQWCGDGAGGVAAAKAELGRLPDLGVYDRYHADSMRRHGDGFLMVGSTFAQATEHSASAVWLSEDGCAWRKDQVRGNGFDQADMLLDAATAGNVTVLIGVREGTRIDEPRLWLGLG